MGQWSFSIPRPEVAPGCTWAYKILPFIEQDNLYRTYSFTAPVKVFMDPGRSGTGLAKDPWSGQPDNTIFAAGQITDYAANAMIVGSGENTLTTNGQPDFGSLWVGPPTTWQTFHRTITSITDGSSNTALLGTKALATNVYKNRGAGNFTMSNGSTRATNDDPITRSGPDTMGTMRSLTPDTTWWMAAPPGGGDPFNPNNPYATDIPGQSYRLASGWGWYQFSYQPVQDAIDLDSWNRWGSPYPGGTQMALCDGSVRLVSYSTSYSVMIPLMTPDGGEVFTLD
jgi:hypothetical protein